MSASQPPDDPDVPEVAATPARGRLRADAARNRARVLDAARTLLQESSSPEHVSMAAVAGAAGVGKGTLFRRFGDRAGLLRAVYDESAEALRAELPTLVAAEADPVERAVAVLVAVLDFKVENLAVTAALESEGAGSPYSNASYGRWHALVRDQVVAARGEHHADVLAHALLAATRSDLVAHLVERRTAEVRDGLAELVRSCLRSG